VDRKEASQGWRLVIAQALGLDLFDISDGFPRISDKWLPELDRIREEMIRAYPAHMPAFEPPPDWTGWWMECPDRVRVPFVRKDWWPEHRAAITERLKNPEWEPAKAANALQRVPLMVDPVMRDLVERFGPDVMGPRVPEALGRRAHSCRRRRYREVYRRPTILHSAQLRQTRPHQFSLSFQL
jgi:hypothetical protein